MTRPDAKRFVRRLRRRWRLFRGTDITQKRLTPAQRAVVREAVNNAEPVKWVDPMAHIRKRFERVK